MNTQKADMLNKENTLQQQDSLNSQGKRESKYERTEVNETPFIIIEEPTGEYESIYIVTLGKYKMAEFGTETDAEQYCHEITWDKIMQLFGILIQADKEMEQLKIKELKVQE